MSLLYSFIISSIAGFSTILGTIPVFFKWSREGTKKIITFSLSFSITIMIGISILELIPEASYYILTDFKLQNGVIISVISLIISITIMLLISKIINKEDSLYSIGILSMITILLHNLPEGIITFFSSQESTTLGLKMAIAIMLHNIPEGISISLPIYFATKNKKKALTYTLISGLAEPVGAIIAYIIIKDQITPWLMGVILIIAAGFMITLAIHDLFPKTNLYYEKKYNHLGFITAIIILILSSFID